METEIVSQNENDLGHEIGRTMVLAAAGAAATVLGTYAGLLAVSKIAQWRKRRQDMKDSAYNKNPKEGS